MSFSLKELKDFAIKLPNHYYVVGSVIREKKNPQDLDLICTHNLDDDYKWFQKHFKVTKLQRKGKEILTFSLKLNRKPLKINIWRSTHEELPFMGLAYSYPRVFNIALRQKAKTMGYLLNQHGLFKNNKKVPIKNIKQIFKILKINYRTPAEEEKKLYGGDIIKHFTLEDAKKIGKRHRINFKVIPPEIYRRALDIELEHSDITNKDPDLTAQIVEAHLKESPHYYQDLIKMEKNYGSGLATYLFQKFANIYRRKYCNNKARDLQDGELHPLCANYCGPGTKIDDPKVRNYPPYNEIDNVCRTHDLAYHDAGRYPQSIKEKKIRQADEDMMKSLEKFKSLEPYYSIAKYAILTKMKFEDWLPMVSKLLFIEHYGKK